MKVAIVHFREGDLQLDLGDGEGPIPSAVPSNDGMVLEILLRTLDAVIVDFSLPSQGGPLDQEDIMTRQIVFAERLQTPETTVILIKALFSQDFDMVSHLLPQRVAFRDDVREVYDVLVALDIEKELQAAG